MNWGMNLSTEAKYGAEVVSYLNISNVNLCRHISLR